MKGMREENMPGIRVIKMIRDVDFSFLAMPEVKDDNIVYKCTPPVHGTILYIAGMVNGDEDALMCVGKEDGTAEFRVAVYPPYMEFEEGWLRLIGRSEEADNLRAIRRKAHEIMAQKEASHEP